MRDIKFRAWGDGSMYHDVGIYPTSGEIEFGAQDNHMFFRPDSIAMMQYTGLKDKNGVEIYEGDILREAGIVSWNDVEVRWSCIDIDWNDKREWHDMLYLTTPLEVIGNIYESPELLKENN